ncbi:MAG: ABC transporter ATP-binding protein [Ignavibacteriae bacterium]|nr:ABC transporter ATP-binding protein [Ignavibacteriota bacterium]
MLEVKNISAYYGIQQVLFDISFEIKQGEIALIIGGNGAGKSSILKSIFGILPLNSGQVIFNGQDITNVKTFNLIKKGFVYLPQKDNFFEDMTVLENLQVAGMKIKGKKELQKRMDYVFEIFPDLYEIRKRILFNMSGGEKQILTLCMALIHKPKMIMIDEPTAGLSPKLTKTIIENIKTINKTESVTFLIVEHKIKEIIKITERCISIKNGTIVKTLHNKNIKNNDYIYTNNFLKEVLFI